MLLRRYRNGGSIPGNNGSIDSGVKGLDTLAELSGYKGDTDF